MDQIERKDLELLGQGSSEAFERLFHQYGGKLYSFIFKLSSSNTYLTEEMVQRTFIKIWDIHTQINPNKSFISYICTIAKNMLMNEYEHQTIEYIYKEYVLGRFPTNDNTKEKDLNRNLLEEYIDKLTEELPPARKPIFILTRKKCFRTKRSQKGFS